MIVDVVIGELDDGFTEELANELGALFFPVDVTKYLEGEIKPSIKAEEKDIRNRNVLVAFRDDRFSPDPNKYTMQNMFVLNTIRRARPKDVNLFIPYMYYARQDKAFLPGEPASLRDIAKLYSDTLISNLFTINSHLYGKEEGKNLKEFLRPSLVKPNVYGFVEAHDIGSARAFEYQLKAYNSVRNAPVIVGPDLGSIKMVKDLAACFDSEYMCFGQKRDLKTGEKRIEHKPLNISDIEGRDVVIYDDVTVSGGTLRRAYNVVKEHEPERVFIAVAHLIGWDAVKALIDLDADALITTDSFKTPYGPPESEYFQNYFQEAPIIYLLPDYIEKLAA